MSSFDKNCKQFFLYICSCRKFSTMVNRRGLLLLLLLGGDVSLNPGLLILSVLNARSIRNKGPLLADMVASNDLEFLCLTETHICPLDSDSFLRSITPPDFIFTNRPRPSGTGGGVGFFIKSSYRPHKIESPFYQSFENMVVSIRLHGRSYLLACTYRTCKLLEEFMSFVGFLSSINSSYCICGDFNIHIDIPVGDGHKFMTFLTCVSWNSWLINLLICAVTYWTSFYLPVIRILLLMSKFTILYLIMP